MILWHEVDSVLWQAELSSNHSQRSQSLRFMQLRINLFAVLNTMYFNISVIFQIVFFISLNFHLDENNYAKSEF